MQTGSNTIALEEVELSAKRIFSLIAGELVLEPGPARDWNNKELIYFPFNNAQL